MTTPGGHPDFQDIVSWRGAPLTSGTTSYNAGNTIVGTYTVPNYAAIHVLASAQFGPATIEIKFYADTGATILVNTIDLLLTSVSKTEVAIPIYGSTFTVTVINSTGLADNITMAIIPSNIAVPKPEFQATQNEVIRIGVTIGIGASQQFSLPYAQPGLACLWIHPRDAAGKMDYQVAAGEPSSLANRGFQVTAPVTEVQVLLVLDERPANLVVINNDGAAAHQTDFGLIAGGAK